MGWELTPPSHGSRPIGLPTKLLRSKRSADEAAEPSENSTNPHRISGVPLILPSGEVSCVRGGGRVHVRAREAALCTGGMAPGRECGVLCAEDIPVELEERTQQRGRGVTMDVAHFHLGSFHRGEGDCNPAARIVGLLPPFCARTHKILHTQPPLCQPTTRG